MFFHPLLFEDNKIILSDTNNSTFVNKSSNQNNSRKSNIVKDFPFTSNDHYDFPYKNVLKGIQELSLFSKLFFSEQNINTIQKELRYRVYTGSNNKYIIDKQNENDILLIMRSIYLQYSKIPEDIKQYKNEINKLNKLVLNEIIPKILTEINMYKHYLKDIDKVNDPINLPVNNNLKGDNVPRSIMDVLVGGIPN